MDDGGSSLSSASYGSCSSSGAEEVVLRIHVPELSVERCLTFHSHDLVWTVKQAALTSLPKELRESFNYGLFCPPQNGRAGKFLDEERPLSDYPLCSPLGYLELKYKRRVYKMLKLEEKTLRALHSRANLRRFLEWVKEGNVEKVAKMCSKGLDPNFHDQETGDTPLTIAARGHLKARKGCAAMLVALVNGGALLDYRTREGLTAMHRAVQADNLHGVRTLLDLGASPNYRDHRGLTPLYYCVTHAKDPLVCEALLHDYAIIGVADHQGWQETHQACRNKLVQHLEHLLFYGADLNGRNASGNTPLHVCAVNNLEDCARVLLFRGCDKNALNYANQNPYQVAVISGNLELAEIINKHQPEDIVPFKSPPRYNPRRRVSGAPLLRATSDPRLENPCVHKPPSPAPSSRSIPPFSSASSLSEASTGSGSTASNNSSSTHPGDGDHHDSHAGGYESRAQPPGGGSGGDAGRETFSDTSSGICSSYQGSGSDGLPARPTSVDRPGAHHPHSYQPNNVHGNVVEADEEEEEEDSESDSNNSSSSSSEGSGNCGGVSCITYDVGTLVVCVKQQIAVDSTQLALNLGDIVQVSGSTDDGLLEGTTRGVTGTFPPSCVQPVRMRNPQAARDSFAQQQLMRTKSHSSYGSDLTHSPHAGATHYGTAPRARKTQMPLSRTVVLHRGKKGFGFVLRGAKAMSPLMERLGDKGAVALQYLDDVDPDGVADLAGLKKGDYLLKINGEDVSQASHEHVVSLIRKSADLVEMTVVTPIAGVLGDAPPTSFSPQKPPFVSNSAVRGSQTLPRKHNFSRSVPPANIPPAPPPRDPSTSLSVGRARARSVVGSLQQHSADCSESLSPSSSSGLLKLASIKARPASALRMTASQVEEMISQNSAGSLPPSPSNSSSDARPPRVYASVAEMKKAKALRSRPPADSRLHKVFHSTPDLTPAPIFTPPGALSSDLNLQSYPGHSTTLNHPNSRHSMADPSQEECSGSSAATGFYPKRVSQYDGAMHGSLDHRKLKRSQSAINSSQLLRDDGTVSPNAGVGQLVKVDISRSNSEYASVAQSVKSPSDPNSSPTSPGIMSSFRPSDSAKLYASPEEIKSVGYRNPQMLAQLNRVKNNNYVTSAKSRSQSLPPTTNRPPVSRLHSDPYADPIDKAASHGDSPVDDDDLPLPPPPPEAELITYAKPQNNRIVTEPNSMLMTTSCIVNKSAPTHNQNKQMSTSYTGPSSSQYTTNCGYSSEEENSYLSQYGDELNSRTIKRKKHSVAFAPNLVKSGDNNAKINEASHYAAPVASTAATSAPTVVSTSSPSKAHSAARMENFSDLIAKKAEERRARLENGGNSSTPGSANSSPNRKTIPPKASKGLSDAILESALFNKQKEKVSNGDNPGSTEAQSKVGSVVNILQKMKNSKSFPNEFTQEDGENSSSGVSSDQEIQQDGSFMTVINTESNSITKAKPKPVMPKSNSVEEFSVSSESSEDASDRTCILTNDKTSTEPPGESSSVSANKRPGTRSRNVAYVSKLPGLQDQLETLPSVTAAKKNGTTVKIPSDDAASNQSSSNHSLPASHPLATSQPLPGHLQEAIHPSNTHVGQAKFSTLQRPQSNSKRFTKAGSDPPSGQNYASGGGTLIRSRSINREELNLNSGSATLDRNFYQANKGGNSSGKAEYERSIDESLQLIRMHMNSLNEVNSLAGIKASHPMNENLRETNSLSPNANKGSGDTRVEEVLAPPPQFSDTSGQFRRNGLEEASSGRGKPLVLRETEDESDLPIRVYKRSNRRVEEDFVAAADDGRTFRYKTLDEWSTKDTTDWLESLFMPEYKDSFETKQIDGAKLLKINNESLINLGVRRVGHRVNMEKSLKRYRPIERIDL
ncbi:Talin N-terminal F0 domain [Trinorchestia longiramus]|nr:Talin N-terminal F0 domain [Trinorchestia longiramus]